MPSPQYCSAALLSPSGQGLSAALRAALRTSFENFDVNRDGALCHTEASAFFAAVGDGPLTAEGFADMGEMVQFDECGRLTFEGLVEMFQDAYEVSRSAGDTYAWKPVCGGLSSLALLTGGAAVWRRCCLAALAALPGGADWWCSPAALHGSAVWRRCLRASPLRCAAHVTTD